MAEKTIGPYEKKKIVLCSADAGPSTAAQRASCRR
jgi:hypothetical protein